LTAISVNQHTLKSPGEKAETPACRRSHVAPEVRTTLYIQNNCAPLDVSAVVISVFLGRPCAGNWRRRASAFRFGSHYVIILDLLAAIRIPGIQHVINEDESTRIAIFLSSTHITEPFAIDSLHCHLTRSFI
jgi:hypothetical protein